VDGHVVGMKHCDWLFTSGYILNAYIYMSKRLKMKSLRKSPSIKYVHVPCETLWLVRNKKMPLSNVTLFRLIQIV